jgi:DNA-binding Lrp family transcriptional regulator
MVGVTENEMRTLSFLVRHFTEQHSINQLADLIGISPGGMHKLLKRLEQKNFLVKEQAGNSVFYDVNYESQAARNAANFALTEDPGSSYLAVWEEDLSPLEKDTDLCILFGSVLEKERDANDIDILLTLPEENMDAVADTIEALDNRKPKNVHAVYQTEKDLVSNIREEDPAIISAIQTGWILWGHNLLVEAVRNGTH